MVEVNPQRNRDNFSELSVPYQKKYPTDYLSVLWACLYCQAKTNGKKRPRGGYPKKSP